MAVNATLAFHRTILPSHHPGPAKKPTDPRDDDITFYKSVDRPPPIHGALKGDGTHAVPLDACIETMRQTGMDMSDRYKETSLAGLAVNVVAC